MSDWNSSNHSISSIHGIWNHYYIIVNIIYCRLFAKISWTWTYVACVCVFQGKCQRKDPPCKYLHPPQHLKEQLLQNGRNNLILKNLQMQAMAGIQPMVPGMFPTLVSLNSHPSPLTPDLTRPDLKQVLSSDADLYCLYYFSCTQAHPMSVPIWSVYIMYDIATRWQPRSSHAVLLLLL